MNTKKLLIRDLVHDEWSAMQRIAADFGKLEYVVYDISFTMNIYHAVADGFRLSHFFLRGAGAIDRLY